MKRLFALAAVGVALAATPARADVITDGSLVVNVDNFGEFNQITLNGTPIDTSSFVQQQFINGSELSGGSPVVVVGPTGTYTATAGGLNVSVVSTILGPLGGNPNSSVFQQSFTITNTTGSPISLESISFLDPDVADTTSNLTQYDPGTGSVYATAPSDPGRLLASLANPNGGATAYHNALLGTLNPYTFANLNNVNGPVGVDDIEHAVGINFGLLGAGQSTTLDFRYLFATNLDSPPAGFGFSAQVAAVPEPATFAVFGALAAGAFGVRRRVKAKAAA